MIETSFPEAVRKIRAALNGADVHHFSFKAKGEGRVNGEANISYVLTLNYSQVVKGDTVEAVIEEAVRRLGWDQRHAPLTLPSA